MPYADPERKRQYDRDYGNARRGARKARSAAWAKAHPHRMQRMKMKYHIKHTYGLAIEEYDRLLREQDGCCAVCGDGDPSKWNGGLDVDHDHTNGQVRGLLCRSCNIRVRYLEGDAARNEAALRYLEAHACESN